MKKILSFILIGLLAVTFVACDSGLDEFTVEDAETVLLEQNDTIAFGAYSTVGLLSNQARVTTLSYTNPYSFNRLSATEPTEVEQSLEKLNEYMSLLEPYTSQDSEAVQVETIDSTNPNYEFEVHYTVQNMDGSTSTFVLYYNIIEVIGYDDIDDELEYDDDDNDDLDNTEELDSTAGTTVDEENTETEQETQEVYDYNDDNDEDEDSEVIIEGVMTINGVEYSLTGEIEVSEDEIETEIKAYVDEENYVEMKQEIENEESKFCFESYENGNLIQKTEIKIEDEDSEHKVELKFLNGDVKGEFTFESDIEDGIQIIEVEYDVNGVQGEMRVVESFNEETGEVVYSFFISEDGEDEVEIEQEKAEYESEAEYEDDEDDDEGDEL